MSNRQINSDEVQRLIESVEGIILLDLKAIDGTWKEHVDEIYSKMQQLRKACGLEDVS